MTVLLLARRYGGKPNHDDEDESRTRQPDCEAIPQLPPMGPWRASGGGDDVDDATTSGNASSTSASSSPSTGTTATAFVSAKFELQYTCNVCETRNRVLVSRQAYREGMVIAVCKGCDSKHWIADNLGGGGINIEDYFDPKQQDGSKNGDTTTNNYGDSHTQDQRRQVINRVSPDVFELERVLDLTGSMTDDDGNTVLE